MTILNRDAILLASDLKAETVPVPEWGGEVLVRGMTASEREHYAMMVTEFGPDGKPTGKQVLGKTQSAMVAMCVIDENGERLFTDTDADALGKKSAKALERVFSVAARLSALNDEAVSQAKNG